MIGRSERVFPPRALIVDDELARLETSLGRATEGLARALEQRDVDVVRALSYEDGRSIVSTDASLQVVLLDWNLGHDDAGSHAQATALLHKLRERHAGVPVFLLADRQGATRSITIEVAEMVDEFVWLLEDTADFVAGRVLAAIDRYRATILPPYARALAAYSRLREHSWSAPGHQGGIAFTEAARGSRFLRLLRREPVPHRHGDRARPARLAARPHRSRRRERALRGARVRRAPQLLGGRRHLGIESLDHAGVHERGRSGRARPELPQVDRAGPDADRRLAGLPAPHPQPLRDHRADRADGDDAGGDPREGARQPHLEEGGRPEAGLLGGHELHLRRSLLRRREGAGDCSSRAATASTSTRRGTATRASTRCTRTTSRCAATRASTRARRCSPRTPRTSCSRRSRRRRSSTSATAGARSITRASTRPT